MFADIVKVGIFVLNVAVAAFFLYIGVKEFGTSSSKGKMVVAAGVYSLLYHVYDMYKNTNELQKLGQFAEDIVDDTVGTVTGVVSSVKKGIDKTM